MSSRRYDTYDSTRTGRDHNHERWIPPSAAAEQGQRRPSSSRHQSYDYGTTTESSRRPHSSSRVHTSNGYPSASLHQSSASQPVPGSSSGKVPSSRTQQQYAAHAQKPSISTSRPQVPASQQSYTRTDETVKRKERTEAYDPYAHHRQQSGLDQPTPHSSTERVQVTEDSRRAHRSRHEYASASASRAASLAATAPQAYSYDIAGERAREKETLRTARDERDRYEDEERARRRRQREEDKLRARQYVERGLQDERYRAAKDERKREDASKPESRKLAKSSHATRAYDERFKDSDESDASRRRLTASYGGRYPGEAVAGTSAQHNTIRQSTIYPQSQRVQSSTTYNGVPSAPIAYPYNLDSSTPRQSSAGLHRSRGVSGQISSEYQLPEQEGYSNHHRLHRERERDRERPRNRETALSGSETEREPRQTHHPVAQPEERGQGRSDDQTVPAVVADPSDRVKVASKHEQQSINHGSQEAATGLPKKGSLSNWLFRRESSKVSSKTNKVEVPRAPEVSQPAQTVTRPPVASANTNSVRDTVNTDRTAQERVPSTPRPSTVPAAPPGLPPGNVSEQGRRVNEGAVGKSVNTPAPPINRAAGFSGTGVAPQVSSSQAPGMTPTPAAVRTSTPANISRTPASTVPAASNPPVPATPIVVPATPFIPMMPPQPQVQPQLQPQRTEPAAGRRDAESTKAPSSSLLVAPSAIFPVAPSAQAATPGSSSRPVQGNPLSSRVQATPSVPRYDIPPAQTVTHQPSFYGSIKVEALTRQESHGNPDLMRSEGTPARGAGVAHVPPAAEVDERYRVLPRGQSATTFESQPLPIPNSTLFSSSYPQPEAARFHREDNTISERPMGVHDQGPSVVSRDSPHIQQSLPGQVDLHLPESYVSAATLQQSSQSHDLHSRQMSGANFAIPDQKATAPEPTPTPYHTPLAAPPMTPLVSIQQSSALPQGLQKTDHPERSEQAKDLVASLNEILSDPFRSSTSAQRRSPWSRNDAEAPLHVPKSTEATIGELGDLTSAQNGHTSRKKSKDRYLKPLIPDSSRTHIPESGPSALSRDSAPTHVNPSQPAPAPTTPYAVSRHPGEQVQRPALAPIVMKSSLSQSAAVSQQPQVSQQIRRNPVGNGTFVTQSFTSTAGQRTPSFRGLEADTKGPETPVALTSTRFPPAVLRSSPASQLHTAPEPPRTEFRTDDRRDLAPPQLPVDSSPINGPHLSPFSATRHSPSRNGHAEESTTRSSAFPPSQHPHPVATRPITVETPKITSNAPGQANGQPVQMSVEDPRLRQILMDTRASASATPLASSTVKAAALPSSSRDPYVNDLHLSTPNMPATLAVPYSRNNSATGAADNDVTPRQTSVRPLSVKDSPTYNPSQRTQDSLHPASFSPATYNITSHNVPTRGDSRVPDRLATQQSSTYPASSVYHGQTDPVYPESNPKPETVQHAQVTSLRATPSADNAARNPTSDTNPIPAYVPPTLASRGFPLEAVKSTKPAVSVLPSIPPAPLPAGYGPPQRPDPRPAEPSQRIVASHLGQANDERRIDARTREFASVRTAASTVPPQSGQPNLTASNHPVPQTLQLTARSHSAANDPHHIVSSSTPAVPTLSSFATISAPVRSNADTVLHSNPQASSGAPPSYSKRPITSVSSTKPAATSLVPPSVNVSHSRESDGLKTPSSLAPTDVRTTPAPPLSATPSQDSSKKKGGFFNTLFRTKPTGPTKPSESVREDSREIWDPPPQSKLKSLRPDAGRLHSKRESDPLGPATASHSAKSSRASNKVVPPAATRAEAPRPVALQIPVQPSGRKSPAAKQGLFAKILVPKRHRTMSSASVEALDGTATNTVLNSPTASTLSTSPPMIPYRDPWTATQEWRNQAEANQSLRGKERRYRPGVTFDLQEDPPPERPSIPRPSSRSRRR